MEELFENVCEGIVIVLLLQFTMAVTLVPEPRLLKVIFVVVAADRLQV